MKQWGSSGGGKPQQGQPQQQSGLHDKDDLNDETFGDDVEDMEADWEPAPAYFLEANVKAGRTEDDEAGLYAGQNDSISSPWRNGADDNEVSAIHRDFVNEMKFQELETDNYGIEPALDQEFGANLSSLLKALEDEDDDSFPAPVHSHTQPIPSTQPRPAPGQLGLAGAAGGNVWGTPNRSPPAAQYGAPSPGFAPPMGAQPPYPGSPSGRAYGPGAPPPMPMPANVISAADLEAQMRNQGPKQLFDPNQPQPVVQQGADFRDDSHMGGNASVAGSMDSRGNRYIPLPQNKFKRMTKQEMAYIIRMQLSQLQTTDPLADDFYFQVYKARKGQSTTASNFPTLGDFGSQPNPLYRNPDGSVKLPQGTLGRIAAHSIRKPRTLMNLAGASNAAPAQAEQKEQAAESKAKAGADDDDDEEEQLVFKPGAKPAEKPKAAEPPRRFMFAPRSLTFLIEEGIRCLMDVEDLDSLIVSHTHSANRAVPDPAQLLERERLQKARADLVVKLMESLDITDSKTGAPVTPSADNLLYKFITLPKGRLLLFRSLLLLPPIEGGLLINMVLWDLRPLVIRGEGANSNDDRLAQVVADIVFSMPFHAVVTAFELMTNFNNLPVLLPILRSRLGCQLAQVFTKKGHDATVAASGAGNPADLVEPQLLERWKACYQRVFGGLLGHISEVFALPPAPASSAAPTPAASPKSSVSASEHKTESKTEQIKKEVFSYAPNSMRWELMAALLSYARKEQREQVRPEMRAALESQFSPLVYANSEPQSRAIQFLARVYLPESHPLLQVLANEAPAPALAPAPAHAGVQPQALPPAPPQGLQQQQPQSWANKLTQGPPQPR